MLTYFKKAYTCFTIIGIFLKFVHTRRGCREVMIFGRRSLERQWWILRLSHVEQRTGEIWVS